MRQREVEDADQQELLRFFLQLTGGVMGLWGWAGTPYWPFWPGHRPKAVGLRAHGVTDRYHSTPRPLSTRCRRWQRRSQATRLGFPLSRLAPSRPICSPASGRSARRLLLLLSGFASSGPDSRSSSSRPSRRPGSGANSQLFFFQWYLQLTLFDACGSSSVDLHPHRLRVLCLHGN